MGDKMRLVSFTELLERIFEEYKAQGTIMDVHESSWYRKADERGIALLGETCGTVLGPAAGPHTQLAINILTSYLTGSRFIELKTVQILDSLEIDKPCIDAYDEGFNTEWSTELSLTEAWMEYAKAWILLHLVEELFGFKKGPSERSFIFNMSVGYDLEGIKTDRMQQYLRRMKDSGHEEQYNGWIGEMVDVASRYFPEKAQDLRALADKIPSEICGSVTLSTMHGCPPNEIEAICSYMLSEQKLDTYVKLNPTLLGFDRVRGILDGLGYDYVDLDPEGFSHDLQYSDAVPMLTRLRKLAVSEGLTFGVKLTNTLACVNNRKVLPGDAMYLSGRALFPLSINLAARLSEHFGGELPISYSGGITIHNVKAVFQTGIRPTMATDLLKPGGYLRQVQMAKAVEEIDVWDRPVINMEALKGLAERALSDETVHKTFRGIINYNGEIIDNLLKETIVKATRDIDHEMCVSVFEDNAGVIVFDDEDNINFKVETHNHPSAIEPYGGAATGIGGVIRDPMGTGLGAEPIANTDIFCFGPTQLPLQDLPKGVLHPRRVMRGVR